MLEDDERRCGHDATPTLTRERSNRDEPLTLATAIIAMYADDNDDQTLDGIQMTMTVDVVTMETDDAARRTSTPRTTMFDDEAGDDMRRRRRQRVDDADDARSRR